MSLLPAMVVRQQPMSGALVCRQCARQLQPQRRGIAKKAFAKYGPKYQAKIDGADREWEMQAEKIRTGGQQSMWDLLEERGYIKDVAGNREDIDKLLTEKRIGAYVGIDPTAPSLHIGHLVPLMPLFWMYMHGYRAVTLIGGATAKIGDPTDRLQSREAMGSATVSMHMVKIHYQIKRLWTNVEEQARRYGYEKTWAWKRGVMQNGHWWNKLTLMTMLQRLGGGLRMGPMLSRESVKRKLTQGDGMSFAEFTYPLMQAWDWWHMYFSQGIQMQIGGSDQYGNIVTGIDAIRIIRESEPDPARRMPFGHLHEPVGFTVPLLTDSSGAKFGKSAGNAVWLDKHETPVFDLYGYFVRRPDADVEPLLRMLTFLPTDSIRTLMREHLDDPGKRKPHHVLAFEVVALVHGTLEARQARDAHAAMYNKDGAVLLRVPEASAEEAEEAEDEEAEAWSLGEDTKDAANSKKGAVPTTLNNAPRIDMQLPRSLIDEGKVARILYAAGMVRSVSEGNRLAIQKGAYVGAAPGQKAHENRGMSDIRIDFTPVHLWFPQDTKNFIIDGKYLLLRKGRHHVRMIEIVSDEEWAASGQMYPGEPNTGRVRKLRQKLKELTEDMDQLSASGGAEKAKAAVAAAKAELAGEYAKEAAAGRSLSRTPVRTVGLKAKKSHNGLLIFPEQKSTEVQRLEWQIEQRMQERARKLGGGGERQ